MTTMQERPGPVCKAIVSNGEDLGCGRVPADIPALVALARSEGYESADEYVWAEDGTLNEENGHFLCDECYIKAGKPSDTQGWVAP